MFVNRSANDHTLHKLKFHVSLVLLANQTTEIIHLLENRNYRNFINSLNGPVAKKT